ncbi:MAG TPA: LuxR C-terminal-related transcriptional regulator [Nocardioides sp.]|uniref:LuxR C-terminal-related transcriptional regulator n=1 Tax=Nocardioides sp. TaxID=35761 RepID=UPI002D80E1C9|nr:LuxR C-terminal-related transcriptional regulator [Nocardioides sp.]HET6651398.1 LuxR C-terminal-related transcriptional regulator [Nocardioides sp.]
MTDDLRHPTPARLEVDRLLLAAKLSIPQPRRGSVSRAGLIEAAKASGCRVVGITAPAGYGKSTLLSQWALAEDRRVAWVSLNGFDDDPAGLLTLLASAYARVSPGNDDLVADMGGPGVSALGRSAPLLAAVLSTSKAPFVIMLDDLHELRSPACHDVLGVVISGIPRGSQLAAASRSEQPHVARLRAADDAWELGASDLALGVEAAEQIFAQAHVSISRGAAAAVTERTEGWPAGLHLAAMIARASTDHDLTVSGDDRFVADYLYRESLSQLPESTQRFLRRTAVLDQLCAPLCDALLEDVSSQDRLRELESSNSFLIQLDRRREWYRYHALFREFLLGELHRAEPGLIMKLHLRAADWYEANGSPALALEHLLTTTTQRDRCVQLVTQLAIPTYKAGHMSTVQRWLTALGDPAIEDFPPLAVLAGWSAALTGQTVEAQRWAALLDVASSDPVPVEGTSFDSARRMLRAVMCAAGPEQMMSETSIAMAQEPPWSPWRDTALYLHAEAHLLAGNVERACVLFAEASSVAATNSNADCLVLSESELALVAMDHGRWDEAAWRLERALAVVDEHRMHDYATSVLVVAVAARHAVHRGDLEGADRLIARAMRARPSCTFVLPFIAVGARLQLAKVHLARGDVSAARHLLREIDDILLHRPDLGALVEEVSALRGLLTSSTQGGRGGAPPLTAAELRLLPYLQTHLTLAEIGERLFVSRNTVGSEVTSIYRKLGVSSRTEAVGQATAIGLLGG